MAKKKSRKKAVPVEIVPQSGSREKRVNIGIEEAENGYVVRGSCEGIGKNPYESKTHVASNHNAARQIANTYIQKLGKKTRGKKSGKKKVMLSKG